MITVDRQQVITIKQDWRVIRQNNQEQHCDL
jgi:hypothetical protein